MHHTRRRLPKLPMGSKAVSSRLPTERNFTNRVWWEAIDQRDAIGLLLVSIAAVFCGVVQLMALGTRPVWLPLGLLLLACYTTLVFARSLAALTVLLAVFV